VALLSVVTVQQGAQLPVSQYSPDVRPAQTRGAVFDPATGLTISILMDLDTYLNTTNASPTSGALTQGGIFGTSWLVGSRNLSTFSVYRVQNDTALSNGFGTFTNSSLFGLFLVGQNVGFSGNLNNPPHTQLTNQINFGSSIGTLQTTNTIDDLGVSTGKMKVFRPGSDVSNTDIEISGKVSRITINGNFDAGSIINAHGINGNIGTINILGNLNGSIIAFRKISSITVHGSISGSSTFDAPMISRIFILGSLQAGTLTIDGNVGTLIDTGDFGTNGQSFTVKGSMKSMQIAGNLNTNTTIQGKLAKLQVGGSVTSGTTVTILNALGLLQVGGNIDAGATISANPLPPLKKRKIGGSVLGTLIG
jgi:hypothetical protein